MYSVTTDLLLSLATPTTPPQPKEQDIYFVVDATFSNNRLHFCQTQYGVEMMIAAMNPGKDKSGKRIGAVLYPRVMSLLETPVAHDFFDLGIECEDAMKSYHSMIDEFHHHNKTIAYGVFHNKTRGGYTFPTVAIRKVTSDIEQVIAAGDSKDRPRIVIIFTDGINDGSEVELKRAVAKLHSVSSNIKVFVAGNPDPYRSIDRPDLEKKFLDELTLIAIGNKSNVIIETDSLSMAKKLVKKLEDAEVFTADQGKVNVVIQNSFVFSVCIYYSRSGVKSPKS